MTLLPHVQEELQLDQSSLQNLLSSQEEIEDLTASEEEDDQDQEEMIITFIQTDIIQNWTHQT